MKLWREKWGAVILNPDEINVIDQDILSGREPVEPNEAATIGVIEEKIKDILAEFDYSEGVPYKYLPRFIGSRFKQIGYESLILNNMIETNGSTTVGGVKVTYDAEGFVVSVSDKVSGADLHPDMKFTWSEIVGKPTTLEGLGVVDVLIKNDEHVLDKHLLVNNGDLKDLRLPATYDYIHDQNISIVEQGGIGVPAVGIATGVMPYAGVVIADGKKGVKVDMTNEGRLVIPQNGKLNLLYTKENEAYLSPLIQYHENYSDKYLEPNVKTPAVDLDFGIRYEDDMFLSAGVTLTASVQVEHRQKTDVEIASYRAKSIALNTVGGVVQSPWKEVLAKEKLNKK